MVTAWPTPEALEPTVVLVSTVTTWPLAIVAVSPAPGGPVFDQVDLATAGPRGRSGRGLANRRIPVGGTDRPRQGLAGVIGERRLAGRIGRGRVALRRRDVRVEQTELPVLTGSLPEQVGEELELA